MHLRDFTAPDSQAATSAVEIATTYHTPAMYNHVVRSWLWARGYAALEGRTDFDGELLYVAAMLHDIGTVTSFDNQTLSYEEAGGHVAVALTAGAGWPAQSRQRVLEVIVRHNWPSVDPALDVESYLLETAAALDISGTRPDDLPRPFRKEVLNAYPRLTLAEEFTACVTDQAARKPTTAAHRLVSDGLARKLTHHPLDQLTNDESNPARGV